MLQRGENDLTSCKTRQVCLPIHLAHMAMLALIANLSSAKLTDNLATSAQGFRRGANRVRKAMWWKDMKMRILIIVVSICTFTKTMLISRVSSFSFLSSSCQSSSTRINLAKPRHIVSISVHSPREQRNLTCPFDTAWQWQIECVNSHPARSYTWTESTL